MAEVGCVIGRDYQSAPFNYHTVVIKHVSIDLSLHRRDMSYPRLNLRALRSTAGSAYRMKCLDDFCCYQHWLFTRLVAVLALFRDDSSEHISCQWSPPSV